MSRIVAYVLGLDKEIAKAKDHYIDDIIVNTEAVGVEKVVAQLANFGLSLYEVVSEVRELYNKHHFGFKKTKYFVQAENEKTRIR